MCSLFKGYLHFITITSQNVPSEPQVKNFLLQRSYVPFFFTFKNFMASFYGWVSTASRLEPLRGGNLLFTTKFPGIPGTHFIDLRRMKG